MPTLTIYLADNLEMLRTLSAGSVALIYIDPPFNTGKVRRHTRLATARDETCDRIPYLARGKTPTDVWWHTIVPTQGAERTGYPTQKPRGVLDRLVRVHSRPGDLLFDFFAGSGTLGEATYELARDCILVDDNPRPSR